MDDLKAKVFDLRRDTLILLLPEREVISAVI